MFDLCLNLTGKEIPRKPMIVSYDLKPKYDRAKSFYGKAIVKLEDDRATLQSYETDVCEIKNGQVYRLWGGYSATTMRHVNEFVKQFGFNVGGKKWWDSLNY